MVSEHRALLRAQTTSRAVLLPTAPVPSLPSLQAIAIPSILTLPYFCSFPETHILSLCVPPPALCADFQPGGAVPVSASDVQISDKLTCYTPKVGRQGGGRIVVGECSRL
jgi:hypothetical protein